VKFRLPLFVAFALGACARLPPSQARPREGLVGVGDPSIVLRYAPADAAAAQQLRRAIPSALSIAQRWGALSSPIVITIHPTHEALEAAAHRPGSSWLRAWARARAIELQSPRTWSNGEATDEELGQVLAHELTHCVIFQTIGGDARIARGIPAWFREGIATTNAGERFVAVSARPDAIDALAITADPSLLYATADQAFRYLAQRYGERRIHTLLSRVRDGTEFPEAFRAVMGLTLDVFEDEFRSSVGQGRTRG
jgi:Peptidase MA superfamily